MAGALRGRVLTDNAGDTIRGIGLAAASYGILSIGDASAKWVILTTGVAWVLMWRGLFGALAVGAVTVGRNQAGGWRRLVPIRWWYVMFRAGLSSFTTASWYLSWQDMQLADTYALGFTAPLIMTLLAIPMLQERIRWRRMVSTLLGFCGVLVMLRPSGGLWSPSLPLLMSGIVAMAVTRIMARQLARTETPECQAFWLMASHGIVGALMLLLFPPATFGGAGDWAVLAFLGISSGLAHCIFTLAYGLAPVSALAPYEYTMLLWGGAAGFLIFGEVPSWSTLAGAAIVAAAGLYNLHRERLRRQSGG
jgi:drug/metabolite transporter (DMT)-like permease